MTDDRFELLRAEVEQAPEEWQSPSFVAGRDPLGVEGCLELLADVDENPAHR